MSVNFNDQNDAIFTTSGILRETDTGGLILPVGSNISASSQATLIDGTVTYSAVNAGNSGNSISMNYISGAIAGLEVVTVSLNSITVKIQSGISTGTQVAAAVSSSPAASALVNVSGTDSSPRTIMSPTLLTGGGQRPTESSAYNGLIRYNSSTNVLEAIINGVYQTLATYTGLGSFLPLSGGTLTGILGLVSGSASVPSMTIGGTSTGIFSSTPNTLAISTNGTLALAIDASQNVTVNTQVAGTSNQTIATTAFVNNTALTLASGTTAVTQSPGTNNATVATTAFVNSSLQNSAAIQGSFKNLKGSWNSNTTATWSADQVVLQNSLNASYSANAVNQTLTTSTSGAGGLDTGTLTASTWYYVWLIYNGFNQNIIMSLSSTTPTMPSGYTFKARIGTLKLDGSKNIVGFKQVGRSFRYILGNNLPLMYAMAAGSTGNVYQAVSVNSFVPPTAFKISLLLFLEGSYGTFAAASVAPNPNYQASLGENPTTIGLVPPMGISSSGGNTTTTISMTYDMFLESGYVYFAAATTDGYLNCLGWEENF